ncbi:MAG: hypothetical protein WDZ93_03670 [Candidatus Paceibacterota bacterium]
MVLRSGFILFILTLAFAGGAISVSAQEAPDAPVITSSTYTDPEQWYRAGIGSFTWELPDDVTSVAVEMATSTDAEPMRVFTPAITSYTPDPDDLYNGAQFIAVQFRNQYGWGEVAYRKLKIDMLPPTDLSITLTPEPDYPYVSTITFSARDQLSGIAGYSLYIGNSAPIHLTPHEAQLGYRFTQTEEGTYRVITVAHDMAGNSTANHFPVFVFDVDGLIAQDSLVLGVITRDGFIYSALTLVTLLSLWFAFRTYRRHRRANALLREEVKEVKEQLVKVFKALRDEIREQVQNLRAQKRLTKGEKAVVDNLTQVLEVSETLVKKEMKDVEKLLK